MNVDDFDQSAVPNPIQKDGQDRLDQIFARQRRLMEVYHVIELNNDLLHTTMIPVDLHERKGQAQLKDMAWRVTEELTEATLAWEEHPDNLTHMREELADAYHFLVELMILAGLGPLGCLPEHDTAQVTTCKLMDGFSWAWEKCQDATTILAYQENPGLLKTNSYRCIEQLGGAMNCLKNKPWKQTHIMTDVEKFKGFLRESHRSFLTACISGGLTHSSLFELYFKKSEVNRFRQDSNY